MIRLLFILWILGDVSLVEAFGPKTASQSLEIRRHVLPCSPSDKKCEIKCSAFNVQEANVTWFKGNQVCSQISVIAHNPNPSLNLEVEYQDKSNYTCVLNSPSRNQNLTANIAHLCQECKKNMIPLPVKKGKSVTLHTFTFRTISKYFHIIWMFGPRKIVIAEILNNQKTTDCDERFKDRLKLDSQTGDLTITDTKKTDSGIYQLEIYGDSFDCSIFNLTVSDPLPSPQISSHSDRCPSSGSECGVECSVLNVSHVTLSWYKGNSSLSSITVLDVNYLCLKLDVKDNGNYSCVVSNSLINETKYLIIGEVCSDHGGNPTWKIILRCVVVFAFFVALICLFKDRRRRNAQRL